MDSQLPTVWSVILAALPASIAAIASGIVAWKSYRTTKKMHDDDQKKRSNENIVADTKRKLEEFYYPYLF